MRSQLFMLLTCLLLFSNSAAAVEDGVLVINIEDLLLPTIPVTEEELQITKGIEKSVGRIVTVERAGGWIIAMSTCSATLVEKDIILTASHCLRLENVMLFRDRLKLAATKFIYNHSTESYFDIPGVTSDISNEQLQTIAISEINSENGKKLKSYLAKLPKIKQHAISEYSRKYPLRVFDNYLPRNAEQLDKLRSMLQEEQQSVERIVNDYAYAKLSKPISAGKPLTIAPHNSEHKLFIAGFNGGLVGTSSLKVHTCSSSESAMDIIAEDILTQVLVSLTAKRYSSQEPFITKILDNQIENLKDMQDTFAQYSLYTITNACNRDIKKGNSGGPQIHLQNGEPVIVGINSLLIMKATYLVGAKAIDAQSSGIINKLK